MLPSQHIPGVLVRCGMPGEGPQHRSGPPILHWPEETETGCPGPRFHQSEFSWCCCLLVKNRPAPCQSQSGGGGHSYWREVHGEGLDQVKEASTVGTAHCREVRAHRPRTGWDVKARTGRGAGMHSWHWLAVSSTPAWRIDEGVRRECAGTTAPQWR